MLPLGAPMAIYACSDCYVCRRYRDLQAAAKLQSNKQKAGTSKTRNKKLKEQKNNYHLIHYTDHTHRLPDRAIAISAISQKLGKDKFGIERYKSGRM